MRKKIKTKGKKNQRCTFRVFPLNQLKTNMVFAFASLM